MKNKITIGQIFGDIALCILLISTYIVIFTLVSNNFLVNLILMCLNIIFLFIFYIRMVFLGHKIESYLIDHKILKNEEKDNII